MYLYFFPAFLPLVSLLPILLTMVGFLAGGLQGLRRRPRTALVLLTACLLSASAAFSFKRYDTARKLGRLPHRFTPESLPTQATVGAWNQLLPRTPLSNLSYSTHYRLVVYGTEESTLDAISSEDGRLAFTLRFAEPIVSEPLIHGDRLYVGEGLHDARHARLVAVRLPEGVPLWQHEISGHVESGPRLSINQKNLVGCAGDAGVYCLAAQDGGLIWNRPIGHCDTTPWIDGRAVYALARTARQRSQLMALNFQDGQTEWVIDLPGDPWGTVAHDSRTGHLLVTTGIGQLTPKVDRTEKGWLHAIDVAKRRVVWTTPIAGMPLLSGILVRLENRTLAIHAHKNGEILAFDTRDGSIRWLLRLSGPLLAQPRLIPGTARLVALAFDGSLYEVDAVSGRVLEKSHLGTRSTSAPAFGPRWAFFVDRATLWAFPVSEGKLQR